MDHPRATAPLVLLVTVVLSMAGAAIGMHVLTTLGITPNTSLIGVLVAIALARVPIASLGIFRSIHVQNLVQTNVSSATFGAANSLLLPIGVPVLIGRPDLVPAMLFGAACGMLIDIAMLYWFFDSRLFPAARTWPHGVAAAEAILAGDRGGRRALVLGAGAAAGVAGSSGAPGLVWSSTAAAMVPMSAFGVAFIGNAWALAMFGLGLLAAAYTPGLIDADLNATFIPHGVMVGAGLAALGQALWMATRPRRADRAHDDVAAGAARASEGRARSASLTRSDRDVRLGFARGFLLYLAAALALAVVSGALEGLSPARAALWVLTAAAGCVAAEIVVGLAAMHAGWFPAFATALIVLVLGLAMGFPPAAAAVLVGFVAAGSPAFADGGYDFKAGWQLRGEGTDPAFELEGRRQQLVAGLVGLLTALVIVAAFHDRYFERGLFPPIDRVYAATIRSGIEPAVLGTMLIWALPGAVLQLAGGPDRQMGVLLATGLLIGNPAAGWAVLAGLAIRAGASRASVERESQMAIFGAGCIAGDALYGFASAIAGSV